MLKPWLRITRLPLAPTAVCDVVACTLFALSVGGRGAASIELSAWLLLGVTSILIYAFGMALNDLADRDVDRFKDASRPLPSGDLRVGTVTAVVLLLGSGALVLGALLGALIPVAIAVCFALLYDTVLKRSLVCGALAMGSVRFANASIAAWTIVYARQAPVTVLLAPACIGLYAAGVIVLSTTEDHPHPRRIWIARGMASLAFIGAALLAWLLGGQPTLGLGVAFGITTSTLFGRTPKPGPPKRMVLEMLLGLYWLAAVVAGGWHDGTLGGAVTNSFFALVVAWLLAIGSQLAIRALRKRPAATPTPTPA